MSNLNINAVVGKIRNVTKLDEVSVCHISHAKYKYISGLYTTLANCAKIVLLVRMLHISNGMEYFVL